MNNRVSILKKNANVIKSRLIIVLVTLLLLSACDPSADFKNAAKNDPAIHARVLAADNGCMGCHAVGVTVVGPAWKLVAKRYINNPDAKAFLIEKIKNGGKGNWNKVTGGEKMPAHKERVSENDISLMVDYILAL